MSTLDDRRTVEHEGITVERWDRRERDRWDEYARESPQGGFFHQYGALAVLSEHTGTDLYPLVGFKGQEPVGVFPVFGVSKVGVSAVFSPPPGTWVFYLGPALLNFEGLKQRRREKRNRRFVEGCLRWLDRELDPGYVGVRTHPGYPDPRPFEWNGFDVSYRYSYVVDLDADEEDLLMEFSGDARRNIRQAEDAGCEVIERGTEAIERTIREVRARHEEQGLSYEVDPSFVVDLYRRLPEGQVRPYVCLVDDEYGGGIVTLEYGDRAARWQGGVKPGGSVPVNELLDWQVMREARRRDRRLYDFCGANEQSLCEYKSKFDPRVVAYQSLERATLPMRTLSALYLRFR